MGVSRRVAWVTVVGALAIAGDGLGPVRAVTDDDLRGTVTITYETGRTVDAPPVGSLDRQEAGALAADRVTVGWLAREASREAGPTTLVLYRGGKVLRSFTEPSMIWRWAFIGAGAQVAVALGPLHCTDEPVRYRLYEVATGKRLDALDRYSADAFDPAWVRVVQPALTSLPGCAGG